MYRVLILISVLVIIALSCTPNGHVYKPYPIIGQWQWVQSVGGFAGETRTPQTTGYNQRLNIGWNNYDLFRNDSLVLNLKYVERKMPSVYFPDSVLSLVIENGITQAFEFSEEKDTLFLYDNCSDCFVHTYLRIR